jgi:hypothetical protein
LGKREAGDHLLCDPPSFGGGGVVDGAELLVTLPGHLDFAVGIAGLQTLGELGLRASGQMLYIVAEQAADLVERVVFVPSVAEGVLLDAAADLVEDLCPEANDVEGVEDRDRVGQLVTDSVRIATEWIQRGLFDSGAESVGLVVQPRLVGGSGAADNRVEKPGVEASVLVTGQIDNDRHRPIGADPRRSPDGSGCGAGHVACGGCPQPARRTRRAILTAPGSPRVVAVGQPISAAGLGSTGSHLILKVRAPFTHDQHAQSGGCSTMLNCEGR